jgi:hypothetical protein
VTRCHPNLEEELPFGSAEEADPKEGERETVAQERDSDLPGVAAALEEPRAEEREESKQAPNGSDTPTAPAEIIPPGSFEELRLVYDQKDHPGDYAPVAVAAARREFEKARREVAPATIVDAAKAWIEAADHPRYAIRLDHWLAGRCWEKKPPEKRSAARGRSSHGRRNGHRLTMAQVAARLVR